MAIKSEADLERILLPKMKNALIKAQDKVHKIIDMYVQRFYADYDPIMYDRVYKLMHSLVKGEIIKSGKGYKAEVYFNLDYLYNTGAKPSGKDVMDVAAFGGHGAKGLRVVYGGSENIWYAPLEVLDNEAIEILKDMLISEGIPIR